MPCPFRSPKALSLRLVRVTSSWPMLLTVKVNVTSPPVSGTLLGLALLVMVMSGGTSLKVIVSSSLSSSVVPSSSVPTAVTMLL